MCLCARVRVCRDYRLSDLEILDNWQNAQCGGGGSHDGTRGCNFKTNQFKLSAFGMLLLLLLLLMLLPLMLLLLLLHLLLLLLQQFINCNVFFLT